MKQVAVTLAVFGKTLDLFISQNEFKKIGLGCKRSAVQIRLRRPFYLAVITRYYLSKLIIPDILISAHTCSNKQAKDGIVGGIFGVSPSDHFFDFQSSFSRSERLLSSLASTKSFRNLNSFIKTTSRQPWGGYIYGKTIY